MRTPAPLRALNEAMGLAAFEACGRLPNGPGYQARKTRLLRHVLNDDARLERVAVGDALPAGYGVGIDERCVEYPWVLHHLDAGAGDGTVLDAGSVFNNELLATHPRLRRHALHIMTLAPERECFWERGISYIFSDLRRIPIRDDFYDAVACVSTLEHVGCDNSHYAPTAGAAAMHASGGGPLDAVRELARVLKPGGTLLLTVPFGKPVHHGWFQVFDAHMLGQVVDAFGPHAGCDSRFYGYSAQGWNVRAASECADAVYARWMAKGPSHPLWPTREPDRAAAARAVACLRLVKA